MHCPEALLGLDLVAALHGDVLEVGINSEILAVTDDDDYVGASQFGDAGHYALKDGTRLCAFNRGDVDAVVGHGDFVLNYRSMLAE